ncbi:MAG: hypothetical protein ACXVZ2_03530 [Gaiellaceae bacterium]
MRRMAVAIVLALSALAVGVAPAGATNECRGLQVCVPVAGPWVVVPTGRGVPRAQVQYQLSCPKGYIAGGLDSELTDRSIDVGFLGAVGAPVNPGITTSRDVVFVASYVGLSPHAPTFRPHLGCMPSSGGGGRIPTAAVVPPGKPTVRRVRNVVLHSGGVQRVAQGCAPGERLVGAAHAIGFYTDRPPSGALLASVTASQAVRGGRVVVGVRSGTGLIGVRAIVQVEAVCAGGK